MLSDEPKRNSTEKFRAVMAQRDTALSKLRSATERVSRLSDPPPADITKPYGAQRAKPNGAAKKK